MRLLTACRLLYLLQQSSSSLELRTECSVVLGSLAMGTENNIKSLLDCQIIPSLLQGWTAHKIHSKHNLSEQIAEVQEDNPILLWPCRSSLPWSGLHWSLPSMSQNSLHQPSHSHASPLCCRLFFSLVHIRHIYCTIPFWWKKKCGCVHFNIAIPKKCILEFVNLCHLNMKEWPR